MTARTGSQPAPRRAPRTPRGSRRWWPRRPRAPPGRPARRLAARMEPARRACARRGRGPPGCRPGAALEALDDRQPGPPCARPSTRAWLKPRFRARGRASGTGTRTAPSGRRARSPRSPPPSSPRAPVPPGTSAPGPARARRPRRRAARSRADAAGGRSRAGASQRRLARQPRAERIPRAVRARSSPSRAAGPPARRAGCASAEPAGRRLLVGTPMPQSRAGVTSELATRARLARRPGRARAARPARRSTWALPRRQAGSRRPRRGHGAGGGVRWRDAGAPGRADLADRRPWRGLPVLCTWSSTCCWATSPRCCSCSRSARDHAPATRRLAAVERALGPLASPDRDRALAGHRCTSGTSRALRPGGGASARARARARVLLHGGWRWWPLVQPVPMRRRLTGMQPLAYIATAKAGLAALGLCSPGAPPRSTPTTSSTPRIWVSPPSRPERGRGDHDGRAVAHARDRARGAVRGNAGALGGEERRRERLEERAGAMADRAG